MASTILSPILPGQEFGRLTVIGSAHRAGGQLHWLCRCVCGNEKAVATSSLRHGRSQSCGCRNAEMSRARRLKHGDTRAPEYACWLRMLARCYDPDSTRFEDWGGRGITVCERWRASYEAFRADMGPKPSPDHSIERKDNNGNYEPDNCVWANRFEQGRNKRNNRWITYRNQTKTVSEWERELGFHKDRVRHRLNAGWDEIDALTRPLRKVARRRS